MSRLRRGPCASSGELACAEHRTTTWPLGGVGAPNPGGEPTALYLQVHRAEAEGPPQDAGDVAEGQPLVRRPRSARLAVVLVVLR
jgi:hypothetical protein